EEPVHPDLSSSLLPNRSWPVLFQLRPRCLDQRSILHPGRTNGLTRPTVQTLVHLLIERFIEQIEASFTDGTHHPKAAARRRHLLAGNPIRRTRRKAH